MSKKVSFLLLFVMLASTFLAACGPPQTVIVKETEVVAGPTAVVKETSLVKETSIVEQTSEVIVQPTAEPVTRQGAWVDTVIMVEEPNVSAGITRLESGELDVYAYGISDPELFQRVRESPDLSYVLSYGSYNEISFNPAGPVFTATNTLNPFAVPAIREAMNMLVDRDYIAQEIFGGLAVPRYVAFGKATPDSAKNADLVRAIELEYAYNPEKAKEVIDAEMANLGATMEDGKWTYNGEPVTLIFLIRVEDERKQIGDYLATELENIGFNVDRQYKTSAEASPIWMRGNPNDGLWHLYTGGWVSTAISRDNGSNFGYFYTNLGLPFPLWQAYVNTPEFYDVSVKLWNNDFTTVEERDELMRQALEMSLQDSVRIWLIDEVAFSAARAEIEINADLSGSVYGSNLWAQTLRRKGQIGGSITIAMPSILTEPWNPVAGSNWIYDRMPQRGASGAALVSDPFTGLGLPLRAERAECVVQNGLPVGASLDWITVDFVDSIEVPGDAWVDWDAANQVFITADEKYTQTQTALTKCTLYYPDDMFQTVTWHDGSPMSAADFVMRFIMQFDQGKPESAIYDEAQAPSLDTFLAHYKGLRIVSTDPLVIENYDDFWTFDAENMFYTWWPNYGFGEAPWHTLVPAMRLEANGLATFSGDKAVQLEVEQISFLAGPTIELQNNELISATAETYIPYAPTMGQFVTADEAAARYENLNEWVRTRGHFWVSTGPLYIERAFPLEGTILMRRYPNYPDMADRWSGFSAARIPVVDVFGEESVTIGKEATFDVYLTFEDDPYPMADVEQVKFLVVDAKGTIAYNGVAEAVADGEWVATLPAETTAALEAGSNSIEIAVVLRPVALPVFGAMQFVTAP